MAKFKTWKAGRRGFTLVELLVVIAIIGILVGMLLPAVQAAREAGRRVQCSNDIKQLALACLAHEEAHTYLPTGGWAWYWAGDPDRDTNHRQPGGWSYNLLPYIDQQALHDLGGQSAAGKMVAFAERGQTPLPVFYCPSRRQATAYPNYYNTCNSNNISKAAHTDYAANAGTNENIWWNAPGDGDPSFADAPGFCYPEPIAADGVMYTLSLVTNADITNGASNAYLLGEKYLNPDNWLDGLEGTDNNPLYAGFDWDWSRWCSQGPIQDRPGLSDYVSFGSVHFGGLNMAMCDGSVRQINYSIDLKTYANQCSRNQYGL